MKRLGMGMAALALFLCACKAEEVQVPELIEMAAVRESYRPVERGMVGTMESYIGHIVPTEYPYFWENSVVVADIKVNVGDHVEPGDVLAEADLESVREQIDELTEQQKLEKELFQIEEENYRYAHEQLEFESTYAWETNQPKEVEKIKKQIEELEENHSFDTLLHEYKQREFQKSIEKCKETIVKGTLVSEVSGVVVYRRDFSKSRMVNGTENVVVIADENDCYVEVEKTVTPREKKSEKKEVAFVYIDGKRCLAEEIAFSQEELAAIENRMQYPRLRYRLKEHEELLQTGKDVMVSIGTDVVYDVPVVGEDSLNEDAEGFYVYVENNGVKEARRIQIGKRDSFYAEIKSGLSEGELVYYSSKSLILQNYDPSQIFEVKRDSYYFLSNNTEFEPASVIEDQAFAAFDGTISEILVESGTQVSKGDLICTIKTTNGSARLSDLKNEEINLDQQYSLTMEAYEKQEKEYEKLRQQTEAEMTGELAALSAEYNAGSLVEEAFLLQVDQVKRLYGYMAASNERGYKQLLCSKQKDQTEYRYEKSRINREYKKINTNNDGQGYVSVCANYDGRVIYDGLNIGKPVAQGEYLFKLLGTSENLISMTYLGNLSVGHEVNIVSFDTNQQYKAHVVGYSGNDRIYATSGKDMIYLTTNRDAEITTKYYLEPEEDIPLEQEMLIQFCETRLDNVLVVPKQAIYGEKQLYSTYYFVWCLKEGILTKQYVTYGSFGTKGRTHYYILEGVSEGDKILLPFSLQQEETSMKITLHPGAIDSMIH